MGNADGIADVLGIGCDKGTENDEKGSAYLEFPHVALEALSLLLENIEPVASKASLRGCAATVLQQVQRSHVALAEKKGLNVQNTSRAKRFVGGKLHRNEQRDFGRRELNRRGSDVDVHLDVATVQHNSDTIWRPFA